MSASLESIPFVDWESQITPFTKPYYASYRAKCRNFTNDIVLPNISKWEKDGGLPLWVYRKAYEYGIYTPDYPREYGGQPHENHPFDYFMDIIRQDELCRAGSAGLFTSLYVHKISVPPVIHFGSEEQKKLFIPVCRGEKIAALAISEPGYGSDVAGLTCRAKRVGNEYIINGMKKWISNGVKADYFVTAVRTGGAGLKGISLLIIPGKQPGKVITSRINTQGHKVSETAMIIFKNARAPASYLIGKENRGFKLIMFNFNRERFGIAVTANALAKCAFVEALSYAKQRHTFGKPLIKHQVIRHKLAECARHIVSTHCFVEKLAYQMDASPLAQTTGTLSANVCLCKVDATRTMEFVARETSQILGGASYVLNGKKIERVYRDVRALAIYGGSEEIMLDVSLRLGLKKNSTNMKDNMPYCDWENHVAPSPQYYNDNHFAFRALMARYVEKEILPNVDKWEREWNIPRSAYKTAYEYGVYSARYPTQYGGTSNVINGEPWDQFYNMILYEQLARAGSGGIFSSLFIQTIAIPPVIHFGTHAQKQMFIPVIRGEKIACLAISEPGYGSDVARLQCKAKRVGNEYIVNGMKKWISNGTNADFYVAAVRTGSDDSGAKGISLLIIPRAGNEDCIITSRIMTQGHHTSHTAMIIFRNARVPVDCLIGEENAAFRYIMYNFNQERFGIACQALQLARVALQESVKYAKLRSTFGRKLIQHQVIRHKIAEMGREIMSTFCFMERLAFAMKRDPLAQQDKSIPANIALLKVQATKTLEFVAREASQILGGASYVEGKIIERIYRDVRAFAIYGGSEEIMLDVSTRLSKL